MPKLNEMFPSKWMKAEVEVCEGEDVIVTINDVTMEPFDDNGRKVDKPVLHYNEFEKPMVCNKTNATIVAKLYGDDTDDWIGKQIRLFSTQVKSPQGGMVDSICVRNKVPKVAAPTRKPTPAAAPSREPGSDDDDAERFDPMNL